MGSKLANSSVENNILVQASWCVDTGAKKTPPAPASTHQLSVIQGEDPANAINPHTTQHNNHPTLRTVDPHYVWPILTRAE